MTKNITLDGVADRIEQAAWTMRRMPSAKLRGYRCYWPDVVNEFNEAYGYNEEQVKLGPPSARRISEMDEVCNWLLWLEKEEVKLVWARANNRKWKWIARHITRMSVRKAQLDWKVALVKISENIKKKGKPNSLTDSLPYQKVLKHAYA